MNKSCLIIFLAIMVFMVAFVCEVVSITTGSIGIDTEQPVARDGTWVDTVSPYKLPEKQQYWTTP